MLSPEFPALFLTQLLFGIAYNAAVAHLQKWQLWHVSTSVIVGVAATLLIATAFLYNVSMPFWGEWITDDGRVLAAHAGRAQEDPQAS